MSAEKRYDIECKSSGSRPEAMLSWWKGSRQIKRMAKNVSICMLMFTTFIYHSFHIIHFSEINLCYFFVIFNDVYLWCLK